MSGSKRKDILTGQDFSIRNSSISVKFSNTASIMASRGRHCPESPEMNAWKVMMDSMVKFVAASTKLMNTLNAKAGRITDISPPQLLCEQECKICQPDRKPKCAAVSCLQANQLNALLNISQPPVPLQSLNVTPAPANVSAAPANVSQGPQPTPPPAATSSPQPASTDPQTPAEQTPAEQTPVEQTPGQQTPGEQPSGEQPPANTNEANESQNTTESKDQSSVDPQPATPEDSPPADQSAVQPEDVTLVPDPGNPQATAPGSPQATAPGADGCVCVSIRDKRAKGIAGVTTDQKKGTCRCGAKKDTPSNPKLCACPVSSREKTMMSDDLMRKVTQAEHDVQQLRSQLQSLQLLDSTRHTPAASLYRQIMKDTSGPVATPRRMVPQGGVGQRGGYMSGPINPRGDAVRPGAPNMTYAGYPLADYPAAGSPSGQASNLESYGCPSGQAMSGYMPQEQTSQVSQGQSGYITLPPARAGTYSVQGYGSPIGTEQSCPNVCGTDPQNWTTLSGGMGTQQSELGYTQNMSSVECLYEKSPIPGRRDDTPRPQTTNRWYDTPTGGTSFPPAGQAPVRWQEIPTDISLQPSFPSPGQAPIRWHEIPTDSTLPTSFASAGHTPRQFQQMTERTIHDPADMSTMSTGPTTGQTFGSFQPGAASTIIQPCQSQRPPGRFRPMAASSRLCAGSTPKPQQGAYPGLGRMGSGSFRPVATSSQNEMMGPSGQRSFPPSFFNDSAGQRSAQRASTPGLNVSNTGECMRSTRGNLTGATGFGPLMPSPGATTSPDFTMQGVMPGQSVLGPNPAASVSDFLPGNSGHTMVSVKGITICRYREGSPSPMSYQQIPGQSSYYPSASLHPPINYADDSGDDDFCSDGECENADCEQNRF